MEMLGWPVSCLPPGYAFNQPFLLAIDFVERISNSHVIKSYTPHNCYGDEVRLQRRVHTLGSRCR